MESGTYYSARLDDTFYVSFYDYTICEFYPRRYKIGETWRSFGDINEMRAYLARYEFEPIEFEPGDGDYSASYAGSI